MGAPIWHSLVRIAAFQKAILRLSKRCYYVFPKGVITPFQKAILRLS